MTQAQVVDTVSGRMHVRWDEGGAATRHGQLVFSAEFLVITGVVERWGIGATPTCARSLALSGVLDIDTTS